MEMPVAMRRMAKTTKDTRYTRRNRPRTKDGLRMLMVDHDGGRSLSIRAGILGADRIDFIVAEISGDMYSTWLAIDVRCEEEVRK